ncbi:ABC transporter ATP-binding protein [Rhodococcus fascians]|nr:ABC transporter ATP-binding protein [Rhodococcus fascians]MBY4238718.1 ABC transporter ATP-binding protein [Rhodococcus fascians]MBY4254693.1 ABC transporter ATP-binding protein [Rhodococcus fascians]MBY4270073.1 ABC transporter ATP-binding protein [Rhodococcus fascians]
MTNKYVLDGLQMTFGKGSKSVTAIDRIDLEIEQGEFVVLLGPSGCGKTTALRCIAGLESATGGTIRFGDRTVFDASRGLDLAPNQRNLGMVFQSYALWPHKTVRQNIAYPLKVRGLTDGLKGGWVETAAELVECGHLLDRFPGQLSGGQQQRVALARGIVARPDLVLFDEPLSNLDALLRNQVRNELHQMHRRLGFTGVYVTHDQTEAFAIGDRLAVLREGRIEQVGTPQQIYARPASEYSANFVGLTNVLNLARDATGWRNVDAPGSPPLHIDTNVPANPVVVRFRPTEARIVPEHSDEPGLTFHGRVVDSVYTGGRYEVALTYGATPLSAVVEVDAVSGFDVDDTVRVVVPWAACSWFGTDGRRLPIDAPLTVSDMHRTRAAVGNPV